MNIWTLYFPFKKTQTNAVNKFNELVTSLVNMGSSFYNAGVNAFQNLWEGMKEIWRSLKDWVTDTINWLKDKFSKLKQYLENCGKTELTLTFTDIETIIGCNLCKSAYNYSAYWTPSPTHTMPNTILAAGFKVVSVDLLSNSLLLHKQ